MLCFRRKSYDWLPQLNAEKFYWVISVTIRLIIVDIATQVPLRALKVQWTQGRLDVKLGSKVTQPVIGHFQIHHCHHF
jgi:hypothetical protein